MNKRDIISIEGNIGSGKTTLINKLQENLQDNFVFLEEPLDEWLEIKDERENTILSKFYSDQSKYSFPFHP
jgi:deoxyadenosine/deoxycytidine kinase